MFICVVIVRCLCYGGVKFVWCAVCCVFVYCVVRILWVCDERMCSVGLRCEGVVNCGEIDKDVCNTTSV